MSERLVILGSKGGPAIRPGGPSPTSSLLEIASRRIVIDCGLGVSRGLVEAGMALSELDLILITHLHSDHVLELGPLLHTAWTAGLKRPVRVFGRGHQGRSWDGVLCLAHYDYHSLREFDDVRRPDIREMVDDLAGFCAGHWLLDEGVLTIEALRVETSAASPSCMGLRYQPSGQVFIRVFHPITACFPATWSISPAMPYSRARSSLHPGGVDLAGGSETQWARGLKAHSDGNRPMAADAGRICHHAGRWATRAASSWCRRQCIPEITEIH